MNSTAVTREDEITVAHFAIEEAKNPHAKYKRIHAAGCRDLRDPLPVESEPTLDALTYEVEGYAIESDEVEALLSPCARRLIED